MNDERGIMNEGGGPSGMSLKSGVQEDLIIGWQTRRDLQRRGIVEVIEHDWK